MAVYSYMDLSTGHLTEAERSALEANFSDCDYSTPRVISHDYGWWVNVQHEMDENQRQFACDYPNLGAVLAVARVLECNWINFDADAEVDSRLPFHDQPARDAQGDGSTPSPGRGDGRCARTGRMPAARTVGARSLQPLGGCHMMSRIEQLEQEWVASLRSRGVQPDLSGPFKHKPSRAALKGRGETPAQVLAKLASVQRRALKLGTLRYVEPNPFQAAA